MVGLLLEGGWYNNARRDGGCSFEHPFSFFGVCPKQNETKMKKFDFLKTIYAKRVKTHVTDTQVAQAKQILANKDMYLDVYKNFPQRKVDLVVYAENIKASHEEQQLLTTEKTVLLEELADICLKYRLKFGLARVYKNDVPPECVKAIFDFKTSTQYDDNTWFYVLAPKKHFKKQVPTQTNPIVFGQSVGDRRHYIPVYTNNDVFTIKRRLIGWLHTIVDPLVHAVFLVVTVCFIFLTGISLSTSDPKFSGFSLVVLLTAIIVKALTKTPGVQTYLRGWRYWE